MWKREKTGELCSARYRQVREEKDLIDGMHRLEIFKPTCSIKGMFAKAIGGSPCCLFGADVEVFKGLLHHPWSSAYGRARASHLFESLSLFRC